MSWTPPSGWRPPHETDPQASSLPWWKRRYRWAGFLALGGLGALFVPIFVGLAFVMATVPIAKIGTDLSNASQGQILSTSYAPGLGGSRDVFMLQTAPGMTAAAAGDLACRVVRPTLAHEGFGKAAFLLLDGNERTLASDATLCPAPSPAAS